MSDYSKFIKAMEMLSDNDVISRIDVDTVGANSDTIVSVFQGEGDEEDELLCLVFTPDGDFDHAN